MLAVRVVFVLVLLAFASNAWAKDTAAEQLKKQADRVAKKTAKLRGLSIKSPIKHGVMSKAQLKARLLKRVHQEYSPADLAAEELTLKRFGLLAPSDKYLDIVIDLLTNQVAGFYDPDSKELFLTAGQSFGGDMLMAHEIDHALQDQHFNLKKFLDVGKHEGDAQVARQALVEGDGTALMLEYLFADMKRSAPWGDPSVLASMRSQLSTGLGGAGLSKAPVFLREGMLFPYIGGLEFVVHFRKSAPWKRIDRIFAKPPRSTEQIIHPRKYVADEKPVKVVPKKLASQPGLELLHHNVNGEFGISVMLTQFGVNKSKAKLAAAGWGGDRLAIYAPKGQPRTLASTVGVMHTTWDTEADAREFADAISDVSAKLFTSPTKAGTVSGVPVRIHSSNRVAAVRREGKRVAVVVGAHRDTVVPVLTEVLGWTKP